MSTIKKVAVLGAGVIGAGWTARLAENGIAVFIYDPAPDARKKIEAVLENAEHAYSRLTMNRRPGRGTVEYAPSLAVAVKDVDLVIEAVPENPQLKQQVYREVEASTSAQTIIASSTSGILPTDLQADMQHPERLLVAHPFNPVYLLPLVELVGGTQTSAEVIERATSFYDDIGMHPLHVRKEIEAFIADRFLEAVWREALWMIKDDIATTTEIDDAIRFGFGLRWAQMGMFETYRLAGGEQGMRHFIAQFGPCLKWPWTKLMDVPELTDELIDRIAQQSDEQSGAYTFRELERIRDDNLVAILQALKINHWGAGATLARYEQAQFETGSKSDSEEPQDLEQPLRTVQCTVRPDWTDYNNHMTESRYLQCFGDATDALLGHIGVDADYIANSGSYFTVETHIRHLNEVAALQAIEVTTQLLMGEGKKIQLFHRMYQADGTELATAEQMLIHVNMETRSAAEPAPHILEKLRQIGSAHAALAVPEGCGRAIGDAH